jgi:hypothetical protein
MTLLWHRTSRRRGGSFARPQAVIKTPDHVEVPDWQGRSNIGVLEPLAGDPTQMWERPDDLLPDRDGPWSALARNYVEPPDATHPEPEPEAAPSRPRIFPLPPQVTSLPVIPADLPARMARITYPPYGASPERWAAVMCQVSGATGTTSSYEQPLSWGGCEPPAVAPALDVARVELASSGLHHFALPAGTGAAA